MPLRVLILAENISMKMGGEAALPFFYARLFEARGAEVWMACHERVGTELREAFPGSGGRIILAKDTLAQKLVFRLSQPLPYRIRDLIVGQFIHISTMRRLRKVARELGRGRRIDVAYEPSPITPKGLSFAYGLGVPVVLGPLCGGLNFPPAFRDMDSAFTRATIGLGRWAANFANRFVPGKLRADVILVANDQTAAALPPGCRGRIETVVDSGVDLSVWEAPATGDGEQAGTVADSRPAADRPVRFVFSGRFVDWKGVHFLLAAFEKALARDPRCELDLIGGGELIEEIKAMVERLPPGRVRLHGWLSRPEAARVIREADVLVMPSLRECGGNAILEAMALGKPVIATNWAGPGNYVNDTCGLRVDPVSKEGFVDGLADAMVRLAASPELRAQLGAGARARVRQEYFDWDSKADRVLEILREVVRPAPGDFRGPGDHSRSGA
jgi:glycosyltransferase involved in cell wall biosynthesis